jgi:6-phosphogluconolactonase (cycloisomerase 2 family)
LGTYSTDAATPESIFSYALDRATKTITPSGSFVVGKDPSYLAIAPDGAHGVAVDENAGGLVFFTVSTSSDADVTLTATHSTPAVGEFPCHVLYSDDGKAT